MGSVAQLHLPSSGLEQAFVGAGLGNFRRLARVAFSSHCYRFLHQALQAQLQFQVRLEQAGFVARWSNSYWVECPLWVKRSGHLADGFAKTPNDRKNSTVPIRASARKGCHTVSRPAPR